MAKGKKTGGRTKGTPNKSTVDIREASRLFLADPLGQAKLLEQYREGTLNAAVLAMFHHYAFGKPKDTLAIENAPPVLVVDELTTEDIARLKAERESQVDEDV